MRQASLFDFGSRPVRVMWYDDWASEARSNAEAIVSDLHRLPSGKGIWPRLVKCEGRTRPPGWDWEFYQCRGGGRVVKYIRKDGTVLDAVEPVDGTDASHPIADAWIDGDTLHLLTEDGTVWVERVYPDSEIRRKSDRHPFAPDIYPEHFQIACLNAGIGGEAVWRMNSLPYYWESVNPVYNPCMDDVDAAVPVVGIVPRMTQDVHHITDALDIAPRWRSCDVCMRDPARHGCEGHAKHGYCFTGGFLWNGKPIKGVKA